MVTPSRLLIALAVLIGACNGSTLATPSATPDPPPVASDDAAVDPDAAPDAAVFDDGTPTRIACTSRLGSGLVPPNHGRLDGQLVAIVAPDARRCPSDASHLHLQILMTGAVYDVAVNLDGFEGETDAKLPGIPFAEGWHPMDLDYVNDLGLHAPALTVTSAAAVRARLELVLASANHISVFGTAYPGSDGAHLIHRNGIAQDGALVVNPLAPTAKVIAFRFANDKF
ncbi:hypothetical protein BH11MYX4_BH11MYX4_67880 [soil metagenome]